MDPTDFELVGKETKKIEHKVKLKFFKDTQVNFDVARAATYLEELKARKQKLLEPVSETPPIEASPPKAQMPAKPKPSNAEAMKNIIRLKRETQERRE